MIAFPLEVRALRVEQPIGVYYVAILQARVLLEVAFSDVLSASLREGEDYYDLDGTQRLMNPKRLQMIADYINRPDAAFPNSIILAANFRKEDGLIEDDDFENEEGQQDRAHGLLRCVRAKHALATPTRPDLARGGPPADVDPERPGPCVEGSERPTETQRLGFGGSSTGRTWRFRNADPAGS